MDEYEAVETVGIYPASRHCRDSTCPGCKMRPLVQWADDRDEERYDVSAEDRFRRFAAGWAMVRQWDKSDGPTSEVGPSYVEEQLELLDDLHQLGAALATRWFLPDRNSAPGGAETP